MMTSKRLFLLDAYALIFRGYYAFIKNPRINSKGMDTSAIMGFMNSLLDVIKREKPDYLAVAFDKGGSHFRVELFDDYKANRDETPEAIKIAVPFIQEFLKAMHIPIIEKEGFEADDLIGTIAKKAEKEGFTVFMVTPDKDFAQLVSENIFMYRPARMGNDIEIWGIPEVLEKFEIKHPLQVIDYLAMMGDAVDNIPGLPGIGEKTAKKLLQTYNSIEDLLANTHELKGKMRENVEANKEKGLLSKKLATIILDCPVEFHAEDYALSKPDVEKTDALFEALEFRRMREQFDKIFNGDATQTHLDKTENTEKASSTNIQQDLFQTEDIFTETLHPKAHINNTPHLYQTILGEKIVHLFVEKLISKNNVCFDTETTGLDPHTAELVGLSFCFEKGKAYYLPIPADFEEASKLLSLLKPFFENVNITKIGQNLKFDIKVLAKYGIETKGPMFDTMIAHYLLNPDSRHNMDILADQYLNYQPISIETLIGKKGKNQGTMRDVSIEEITTYAAEDADITYQLYQIFREKIASAGLSDLFNNLEIPLVDVLAAMEWEGISLDTSFLKSLSEMLSTDIQSLENQIYTLAEINFNLGSPKQLGEILFEKLKIGGTKVKKTKTGQYATGEEVLVELKTKHPIIEPILEWRQLNKLQNTYVDALPNQVNSQTKRVHTEFMQTVAATGRLSSNNPNLQNIPIRTERGRLIRKAFVAKNEDYVLLAADYSQIELRIIAAISGEENMIEAFNNGEDIHRSTASKVFQVPLNEVTKEQRSQAKTVNFGIIYGVSAFGLSNQTSLSRSESKELIETYFKTYPKLKTYMNTQIAFARSHGYVQTVLGRRRFLKDINSANQMVRGGAERNAINAPIQGSAADIIKIAMIRIHNRLKSEGFKTKMLLQVHDELVFDVPKHELEIIKPIIKSEMEQAYPLDVPLVVDLGWGKNWLEAHG